MDPSIAPYLEIADKLGVMVLGVIFILALYKKGLVFGWLYADVITDLKSCREELNARIAKAEAELEELRRGRRQT